MIKEGGVGVTISSQSGHKMKDLGAEIDNRLATTPTEELLDLEVLQIKNIKDTLHAYQLAKRVMDSLTDREMDVLRLIATGLSNKQIAGQLFISEETVKVHIRNLLRKLNVHSRVAATVLFFERNGR